MNVTILGSGFGLYGYLPALLAERCRVLLPERYRAIVEGRAELSGLAAEIGWVADEREALDLADALVVARRPADQADMLAEILHKPRLKRLLLEKPLAQNPAVAAKLQDQIETSGKIIRMGYTFGFTGWGQNLMARAGTSNGDIRIRWTFRAHHYAVDRPTWKRFDAQGGGALRFYGIQLICLLAQLGFDTVLASSVTSTHSGEVESWRAKLVNNEGSRCDLEVDSNSEQTGFSVDAPTPSSATSLPDPFAEQPTGAQDRRVSVLSPLCREMLTSQQTPHLGYARTIALWRAIEDVTVRSDPAKS
jgi:predicted dehydrogenase